MIHQAKDLNKILSTVIVGVIFHVQSHSTTVRFLFQAATLSIKIAPQILRDFDIHSCPVGLSTVII